MRIALSTSLAYSQVLLLFDSLLFSLCLLCDSMIFSNNRLFTGLFLRLPFVLLFVLEILFGLLNLLFNCHFIDFLLQ